MKLNVYLISHPIIKQFSHNIINAHLKNEEIYSYHMKFLGFLLMYEILRKWIKIHNIYIKNIDLINELCIFDSKESYLIIGNLIDCIDIVSDIKIILPKLYLQHINFDEYKNNPFIDHNITNIIKQQKIIIIDKFLTNYTITELLDYLLLEKQIKIQQIKIMCITCTNSILEHLGNKYQYLEIYTTKIYNY